MSADKHHQIWIEQCEAARTIRERYGLEAAFDYAVGEKLMNFASAARDHPAFARELPRFVSEVRPMFLADEIRTQLARLEREQIEKDAENSDPDEDEVLCETPAMAAERIRQFATIKDTNALSVREPTAICSRGRSTDREPFFASALPSQAARPICARCAIPRRGTGARAGKQSRKHARHDMPAATLGDQHGLMRTALDVICGRETMAVFAEDGGGSEGHRCAACRLYATTWPAYRAPPWAWGVQLRA